MFKWIANKVSSAVPKVVNAVKGAAKAVTSAVKKVVSAVPKMINALKNLLFKFENKLNKFLDSLDPELQEILFGIERGKLGNEAIAFLSRWQFRLMDYGLKKLNQGIESVPWLSTIANAPGEAWKWVADKTSQGFTDFGRLVNDAEIPLVSDFVGSFAGVSEGNGSLASVYGAWGRGIWVKGVGGTLDGLMTIVTNPLESVQGVTHLVANAEEMAPKIAEQVGDYVDEKLINGTAESRAEFGGQVVFEVVTAVLTCGTGTAAKAGVKGADTAIDVARMADKASDAAKAADKASDAAKAADKASDAAKAADKASDAAKAADKASDAAKAADKASDAVKTADKASDAIKTADKASDAAKTADKAEDAAKTADKASDAAKTADKASDAAKTADKAEDAAKAADKAGDAAKTADKAGDVAKTADKAGDATKAADKAGDAAKTADKANDATKAADKAGDAAKAADKAGDAAKVGESGVKIKGPVEEVEVKKVPVKDGGKGPVEEVEVKKVPGESGSAKISSADRAKIDAWDYKPSDELYLKYKDVFDNPKYYDQKTGSINWPKNDGFASTPVDEVLQPGTRIDRYGSDYGTFTSPEGIPYEMRAVAPGTDLRPYSVFEVVEPIKVKAGEIAPWFDEPGGGIQYLLPDTVDELLDAGVLRRIK